MNKHEFYRRFSKMGVIDRKKIYKNNLLIGPKEISMDEINRELKFIDDKIRDDEIKRNQLLDIAAGILIKY